MELFSVGKLPRPHQEQHYINLTVCCKMIFHLLFVAVNDFCMNLHTNYSQNMMVLLVYNDISLIRVAMSYDKIYTD